jgi:hypothetical protein
VGHGVWVLGGACLSAVFLVRSFHGVCLVREGEVGAVSLKWSVIMDEEEWSAVEGLELARSEADDEMRAVLSVM